MSKKSAQKRRRKVRIPPEEYQSFLIKIGEAISDFSKQDKNNTYKQLNKEVVKWLNTLKYIEEESFKAGVCVGLALYINELLREEGRKADKYVV